MEYYRWDWRHDYKNLREVWVDLSDSSLVIGWNETEVVTGTRGKTLPNGSHDVALLTQSPTGGIRVYVWNTRARIPVIKQALVDHFWLGEE